jgi:hypothetical protein
MQFKYIYSLVFFALLGLTFSACVDQDFDEPPVRGLTSLTGNITVKELKDLHSLGSNATPVPEGKILAAVVVADDESGNLYQQLVLEDATGGIIIRLGDGGLYTRYPVGTEVFVRMDDLYINDFNNLYQIAGDESGGLIASPLINTKVVAGENKGAVPTSATLEEIVNNNATFDELLGRLITLEGIQFAAVELGDTYAVPGGGSGRNRTFEDCFGNSIVVRNSDFADFAGEPIPEGNGMLTAVLTVFGDTKQMLIRDLNDVQFTAERCGVVTGGNLVSIMSLREAYNSGSTAAPDDSKIQGVVISDRANGNINGQNIVIQDGTAGIVVRFSQAHSFDLGESVEIVVSGQELSDFNGLTQVNNLALGNATSLGNGTLPAPREATVAELLANGDDWESTLVRINMATMNGGPTYGDGVTVADGTGSIAMFTFFSASFSGNTIPSSEGTLTAILSDFNGLQLNMRNADDADFEGGGGGDPTAITAAELRNLFNSGSGNVPAAKILRGIVISDVDNGNLTGRNLVIQDASGGIVVRFTGDHSFALGEDIEINVSNQELSEFNGLLQVNNVANTNAISYGPGTLPTPRMATIQQIKENAEEWESTLVQIDDVAFTEGGTYEGTKVLEDDTDTIEIFTRTQASFSGASVPDGAFTIVAIVSEFTTPQVIIRNLNDIME